MARVKAVTRDLSANALLDTMVWILNLTISYHKKWHEHIQGQFCEQETDECSTDPCLNNGTCVDLLAAYECQCAPGFQGKNCEEDIDECDPNPCKNGSFCTDLINAFKCICEPGFTGTNNVSFILNLAFKIKNL